MKNIDIYPYLYLSIYIHLYLYHTPGAPLTQLTQPGEPLSHFSSVEWGEKIEWKSSETCYLLPLCKKQTCVGEN